MTMIRKLATLGTAALVALTLAAPASAEQPQRVATIDCGDGPREVGSTNALWAPLVDLRTGEKYKPLAWKVAGEGFAVDVSKRGAKQGTDCSYDDGEATGTVTVRP